MQIVSRFINNFLRGKMFQYKVVQFARDTVSFEAVEKQCDLSFAGMALGTE